MKKAKNELLMFLAGLLMLVVGLYIFMQRVTVTSGFFSMGTLTMKGMSLPTGVIFIPLIAGIIWMFASDSILAKIFTALSVLLIIFAIVISTHIYLNAMSLFDWVVILVLIFGGIGLLARVLFANHSDDKKE